MFRRIVALLPIFVVSFSMAAPAQIILLRHGEKENAYALCDIGQLRAEALAVQFLGKNAEHSLFSGQHPDAFVAITLHTLELAAPAARSWHMPVMTYAALPEADQNKRHRMDVITLQTQLAAEQIMNDPQWQGKTVVMVWEHKHIANQELETSNPGLEVTLKQLLKLDQLPEKDRQAVPKTWRGDNYNFFWIIDYNQFGNPIAFKAVRQNFTGTYVTIPNNDWGVAEALPQDTRCKHQAD